MAQSFSISPRPSPSRHSSPSLAPAVWEKPEPERKVSEVADVQITHPDSGFCSADCRPQEDQPHDIKSVPVPESYDSDADTIILQDNIDSDDLTVTSPKSHPHDDPRYHRFYDPIVPLEIQDKGLPNTLIDDPEDNATLISSIIRQASTDSVRIHHPASRSSRKKRPASACKTGPASLPKKRKIRNSFKPLPRRARGSVQRRKR